MFKSILCVCALFTLLSFNSYGKLIAYWSFDDGTAKDNSGNGYDGEMVNNPIPIIGVHGKGLAMKFKGNDYSGGEAEIGSHINLPAINLSAFNSYTIELWAYDSTLSAGPGENYIIFGDHYAGWVGILRHTDFVIKSNGETIYLFTNAGNANLDNLTRYVFPDSNFCKWTHYAITYNAGVLKTYINGYLAYTQTGFRNPPLIDKAGLACHTWYDGTTKSARLFGALDEVKIYNEELSDSAIKEIAIGTSPTITSTTSDCYQKIYELKADSIGSVSIVSNDNTSISYSPKTPAKVVDITVKLINNSSNGYYTIKVAGTNGQSIIIKDSISLSADASLDAVYPLGTSYYRLDSTGLGNTIYTDVTINNPSNTDVTIDKAYFIFNTEYSVVPSELPITISAGSVGKIKVAFNPTTLKERIDTLYIPQACGVIKIPFNTICKANEYDIHGECEANAETKSASLSQKYINILPNPAINSLKVRIKVEKAANTNDLIIVNSLGDQGRAKIISSSISKENGMDVIEYQIDISALNSGIYQLVYNGAARISKSFVVDK